jgi:hypothetical protein
MNAAESKSALQRRWYEDPSPLIYIVVEIKVDGGDIRKNSMRALSAMAVAEDCRKIAVFNVNLLALEGTSGDPRTLALAREHPEAWRATTQDAQRSSIGIPEFAKWVKNLPGQTALVASPLTLTTIWLEHYLRRFTTHSVYRGPFKTEPLFFGPGIDLSTLVMGVTGRHYRQTAAQLIPPEWCAHKVETHNAREDVDMNAELLISMLRLRGRSQD